MTFDDLWWPLMTFDDVWWRLMTFNYLYRLLMTFDDLWWPLLTFDDLWWPLMTFDDPWCPQGCFLYAKLILDLLESGQLVVKSGSYKVIPRTLAEIYQLALNLRLAYSFVITIGCSPGSNPTYDQSLIIAEIHQVQTLQQFKIFFAENRH